MNISNVLSLGSAIIAFSIGSGFATGQEVLQFFTAFGFTGTIGAAALTMLTYILICSMAMEDGKKLNLKNVNTIWIYYCGKYMGNFLKYFVPIFFFGVLILMTAGAGATLNQYYGIPTAYGRAGMLIAIFAANWFGIKQITKLIGSIGYVIISYTLFIGISTLITGLGNLPAAEAHLATHPVLAATENWAFSGILYTSFMALGLGPFLAGIGPNCNSNKEAKLSGIIGGFVFACCIVIMALAILAHIQVAGYVQVPTLELAKTLSPIYAQIFSIILMVGIFNPLTSILWIISNFLIQDEHCMKAKILRALVCICAFFGSVLPFDKLVGFIYSYTGYLGIIIMVMATYTHFFKKEHIHPETGELIKE